MVSPVSYHFRRMFYESWSRADGDFHFVQLAVLLTLDFEVGLRLRTRKIFDVLVFAVQLRSSYPMMMMMMLLFY
jgi:hypothetical protein